MAIETMSVKQFVNREYTKPYNDVEYYGERLEELTNLFLKIFLAVLVIKYLPMAAYSLTGPLGGL